MFACFCTSMCLFIIVSVCPQRTPPALMPKPKRPSITRLDNAEPTFDVTSGAVGSTLTLDLGSIDIPTEEKLVRVIDIDLPDDIPTEDELFIDLSGDILTQDKLVSS